MQSKIATELSKLINQINQMGWSVATGTNYSYRINDGTNNYWISKSGIDKSLFKPTDFLEVNLLGNRKTEDNNFKPSAENLLHALIYQKSDAMVVLHTHSQYATVLSQFQIDRKINSLTISGYEVQKALANCNTHEQIINVPIFQNSQDMNYLSNEIASRWNECEMTQGFLLGNHGFYCWGNSIPEVKKYLEAYEFLFECIYKQMILK